MARKHPDTLFVVHNGAEPVKNIATFDFYYNQFGYLLGRRGARSSARRSIVMPLGGSAKTEKAAQQEGRHAQLEAVLTKY